MKKILALILCLSVVLTSFGGIVFAQEETAEQVVFSDEFLADYDEAKGLLDMLFGEKVYQDGLVTRGDFVVSLFKLLKLDTMAVEDAFFKDVSKRDDQAPYIYTAVRLGWVSKAQNFEPGRVITPNEALKILCCAMNYGFIANNKGGYPGGYQYVANKLDLLDNLELKGSELDSKNAYVLLFNAVTAPTLEPISFGDTEEYDSTGKSLLYGEIQSGLCETGTRFLVFRAGQPGGRSTSSLDFSHRRRQSMDSGCFERKILYERRKRVKL